MHKKRDVMKQLDMHDLASISCESTEMFLRNLLLAVATCGEEQSKTLTFVADV